MRGFANAMANTGEAASYASQRVIGHECERAGGSVAAPGDGFASMAPLSLEGAFSYCARRYRFRAWVPSGAAARPSSLAPAPVVLVHGFAQACDSWERVACALAAARPVFAIDLIGHGGSDRPVDAAAYDLAAQGRSLLAFADAARACSAAWRAMGAPPDGAVLPAVAGMSFAARRSGAGDVSRETSPCGQTLSEHQDVAPHQGGESDAPHLAPPRAPASSPEAARTVPCVALVGYSMGGRVVLAAAHTDPEKFAAIVGTVVLESAGLGPDSPDARRQALARDRRNASSLRRDGIEAFMDAWARLPLFATQTRLPQSAQEAVRATRLANDPDALALTFERAGQHTMPSREESLRTLAGIRARGVRVFYLAGELDAKYRALADELADPRRIDGVAIVAHAGHNVHLERPDAYVRVLQNRFL